MPLQGHNMLSFIFMLALHIGCCKLSLITHDEVGALCWLYHTWTSKGLRASVSQARLLQTVGLLSIRQNVGHG